MAGCHSELQSTGIVADVLNYNLPVLILLAHKLPNVRPYDEGQRSTATVIMCNEWLDFDWLIDCVQRPVLPRLLWGRDDRKIVVRIPSSRRPHTQCCPTYARCLYSHISNNISRCNPVNANRFIYILNWYGQEQEQWCNAEIRVIQSTLLTLQLVGQQLKNDWTV